MIRWILKEVWEKINVLNTWREIKKLGQKYGKRFFWAAIIWELIEDIVFPFLAWRLGVPGLIPIFLILHFEPIVYPAFFWGFRMWDRFRGREPWNPERTSHSAYWRSVVKVIVFQISIIGWLSHFWSWKLLLVISILTTFFGFIHERIWHDTNFGILPNDDVQLKRVLSKAGTYVLINFFILFPLLKAFQQTNLLMILILPLMEIGIIYFLLENMWSKSLWGVRQ